MLYSSNNINHVYIVQVEGGRDEPQPQYETHPHYTNDEKPWWFDRSDNSGYQDDHDYDNQIPLGDRASPEGLEMPKDDEGRKSPYDNIPATQNKAKRPDNLSLFISKHTNIDEILGGAPQIWSPVMKNVYRYENDDGGCTEVDAAQVIIHEGTSQRTLLQPNRM